jgi:hypothetical protein
LSRPSRYCTEPEDVVTPTGQESTFPAVSANDTAELPAATAVIVTFAPLTLTVAAAGVGFVGVNAPLYCGSESVNVAVCPAAVSAIPLPQVPEPPLAYVGALAVSGPATKNVTVYVSCVFSTSLTVIVHELFCPGAAVVVYDAVALAPLPVTVGAETVVPHPAGVALYAIEPGALASVAVIVRESERLTIVVVVGVI